MSVTGSLTHVASMSIAPFVVAVAVGYTGQTGFAYVLVGLGAVAWFLYMFLAIHAYLEDRGKKAKGKESSHNSAISKAELLEMTLKAKEKYSADDLERVYEWLNGKNS